MRIDILTLFGEYVDDMLSQSIIGRARAEGKVSINCKNIRDYSKDKTKRTDDYPYGGGRGMVMQGQPIEDCLKGVPDWESAKVVLLSPRGRVFSQEIAKEYLSLGHIILLCGHYEGVDQRFIDRYVDEELSLGDFVLTGGELAAAAVADAVCRMVPGVLAEDECFEEESHFEGLLEYPHYTRPEAWNGSKVPEILLSGDHEKIRLWRREQALRLTMKNRPDMFEKLDLTYEDINLLSEDREEDESWARLKTDRLVLRKLRLNDAESLFKNIYGDKEIADCLGDDAHGNEAETLDFIKETLKKKYYWGIALKGGPEIIGVIYLTDTSLKHRKTGVRFALSRKAQKNGFMKEALSRVLGFAFDNGFNRAEAWNIGGNHAAGAVMRACGMLYEGKKRDFVYTTHGAHDCDFYAMLKRDKN